jgi:hypothetical protein
MQATHCHVGNHIVFVTKKLPWSRSSKRIDVANTPQVTSWYRRRILADKIHRFLGVLLCYGVRQFLPWTKFPIGMRNGVHHNSSINWLTLVGPIRFTSTLFFVSGRASVVVPRWPPPWQQFEDEGRNRNIHGSAAVGLIVTGSVDFFAIGRRTCHGGRACVVLMACCWCCSRLSMTTNSLFATTRGAFAGGGGGMILNK